MAIYIQIVKRDDLGDEVVYDFGPAEGIIGQVAINKTTGAVTLLDIHPDAAARKAFYIPRIARILARHFECQEFPDRTCYAA